MMVAFLLGGGRGGWMVVRGYKLIVIGRIRSAGLMDSLVTIINNMDLYILEVSETRSSAFLLHTQMS